MKKIVVATDFSKGSEKALAVAKKIAKINISEIILLHCYSPTYVDPSVPSAVMANIEDSRQTEIEKQLEQKAREVQETGIRTSFRFLLNSVGEGINELAESDNVDFAIIGKTGETGFLERLIGSNAEHVINSVQIPLLVVPESVESIEMENVFYATQLEQDESVILQEVFNFSDKIKAKAELFNINTDTQLDLHDDRKVLAKLKSQFPNRTIPVTSFRSNNVSAAILEHVESIPNSILVLASHHRNFLDGILNPSMSKKIIAKTNVITLVYHFS